MDKNGKVLEKCPEQLYKGNTAMVKLVPLRPIVVEVFKEYPRLGRIVLRDQKRIVAIGAVMTVKKGLSV
jgi:elongation factor 1-alpha